MNKELTPKQKKKLEKLSRLIKQGEFAILTYLFELEEKIEEAIPEITNVISRVKGDDGYTPEKGVDYFDGEDGRDGKDGKDYILTESDKKEIAKKITVPVVEKVIEKTERIVEKPTITEKTIKIENPVTGEEIIEKINSSENKIDSERIEGLDDKFKELRTEIASTRSTSVGGVRRVYQPYLDDFSAQTDGVTKTFYLSREPLKANAILVWGTDFPIILRPTTDFTVSGKTLTLTSSVPAPSQGATLLIQFYA
jgi:hypothetical protein